MWYCISIHLVSLGLKFYHKLIRGSFDFMVDEDGLEYAKLAHETTKQLPGRFKLRRTHGWQAYMYLSINVANNFQPFLNYKISGSHLNPLGGARLQISCRIFVNKQGIRDETLHIVYWPPSFKLWVRAGKHDKSCKCSGSEMKLQSEVISEIWQLIKTKPLVLRCLL